MEQNYFECPICGKVTRHIEVKLMEVAAATDGGKFVKAAAAVSDYLGGSKIIGAATGYRFWKCGECASIFTRNIGGDVEETLKVGTPNSSIMKSQKDVPFYVSLNTLSNYTINIQNITNIYVNSEHESQPAWVHKHTDKYLGSKLDLYSITVHISRFYGKLPEAMMRGKIYALRNRLTDNSFSSSLSDGVIVYKQKTQEEVEKILKELTPLGLDEYVEIQ